MGCQRRHGERLDFARGEHHGGGDRSGLSERTDRRRSRAPHPRSHRPQVCGDFGRGTRFAGACDAGPDTHDTYQCHGRSGGAGHLSALVVRVAVPCPLPGGRRDRHRYAPQRRNLARRPPPRGVGPLRLSVLGPVGQGFAAGGGRCHLGASLPDDGRGEGFVQTPDALRAQGGRDDAAVARLCGRICGRRLRPRSAGDAPFGPRTRIFQRSGRQVRHVRA